MPLIQENDLVRLSGEVTQSNVVGLLAEGEQAIANGAVRFDLAGVARVDSAALSLLLAWQRRAGARGSTLQFLNMPDSLNSLIALYGVGELFAATRAA